MPSAALSLLFFLSGISGLIYQLVWVRAFGNVFGNTIYSASIVVAVFMLGLGVGGYAGGRWADRRYAHAPESLLRAYGGIELAIAMLGVAISLTLPHLAPLAAAMSSYGTDSHGWFTLSPLSYVARGAIATLLLTPATCLMGATLTLLIRHRVRVNVRESGWSVAVLYSVNTAGAAAGALLTDFALVPSFGLLAAQMVAVTLNIAAGAGAIAMAAGGSRRTRAGQHAEPGVRSDPPTRSAAPLIATSLALSGFAAMGFEILWLRHITLLLGGFRAVFALVLTTILIGIGAGALVGGVLDRRTHRPASALMAVQALLVIAVVAGIAAANRSDLAAQGAALDVTLATLGAAQRRVIELWYNARPILLEVGLPSLLAGCSFPLANAIVQDAERSVGRRAGALYLGNTAGAVCGSLATGFLLLPAFGLQHSATILAVMAAAAIVPVWLATGARIRVAALPLATAAIAILIWLQLPPDFVVRRALAFPPGERLLDLSESINEIVAIAEVPGRGRALITNGHAMTSTALFDQRYMRALAHVPLLAMPDPSSVLVIGFGAGNTTHAAALHASVRRIDVADLSRAVLEHADWFADANRHVLADPRVHVFVNDGRQHLHMIPGAAYDLVTLEPPPIAHAGVGALYSREFYQLARSRLKPGGYVSQWLPAYQVPADATLAMVRAFHDVFPQSVLLSGMQAELLLVGTTAPQITIDPDRLAARLEQAPAVAADLRRVDLGTPTEIVGTFVGSSRTLARATSGSPAVSDDRPLQEYGVVSALGSGLRGVPASLFELTDITAWCPRCADAASVAGLDTYLALLERAYHAPVADATARRTRLLGSAYLGAVVPDTARTNRDVATVLAERGDGTQAVAYLRRAVELDPSDPGAQHELGRLLLEQGDYADAAEHLRAVLRVRPDSAAAHNDLGVALASAGSVGAAVEHFRAAVDLEPDFAEARRNLEAAQRENNARCATPDARCSTATP